MKIAAGADHAGYVLKDRLARMLRQDGHTVEDVGTFSEASVDYPDFASAVAAKVASGEVERGVVVCGSGIGVAIAANKVEGIRAACCNDLFSAKLSRAHNDANVVTLGERVVGSALAEEIVRTFLATPWEGGRHGRRIEKIHRLEKAP
ncbi:MAG: ribose 5-phosphate isomerase B [Thermoanaerobaculia bacterium]